MRQLYLVAYDIRSHKSRNAVLRAIRENAVGGQKSVYECWLDTEERCTLQMRLDQALAETGDRALLIQLDPRATVHALGVALSPQNDAFFYQG